MGTIQSAQAVMHYRVPSLGFESCRNCGQSLPKNDGLRCSKGGFGVAPLGTCKHWLKVEPAPAPAQKAAAL
jgi:hypothetical protein